MKKLKNYQEIQTEDGSTTLYSRLYDENCHSLSGAIEETKLHYIQGCNVDRLVIDLNCVNILEVGFGTGIGFQETLKLCEEHDCFLNFISFEIDPELIEYFLKNNGLEFKIEGNCYKVETSKFTLIIMNGNARETIHDLTNHFNSKFHAIYQDAFSPKRNAILWTTEWFRDLAKLALPECILSTYSASSSIRKSLIAAGWAVTKGTKFGPKRSSTRANLQGICDQDILEQLKRSPALEITDNNYNDYRLNGGK